METYRNDICSLIIISVHTFIIMFNNLSNLKTLPASGILLVLRDFLHFPVGRSNTWYELQQEKYRYDSAKGVQQFSMYAYILHSFKSTINKTKNFINEL